MELEMFRYGRSIRESDQFENSHLRMTRSDYSALNWFRIRKELFIFGLGESCEGWFRSPLGWWWYA